MEWFLLIPVALIGLYIWFSKLKKHHIDLSKKTSIPLAEWYSLAKHSSEADRLNMCKHLILESFGLLTKSQVLDDATLAKLIDVQDFNASNFIPNILSASASPRIRPEYEKQLEDIGKPAREYFAIAIISIIDCSFSKEAGLERIYQLSKASSGLIDSSKWE